MDSCLKGKAAVVAGGAGEVGEGIVRALLRAGASVLVPCRHAGEADLLRERIEPADASRLTAVVADLAEPSHARRIGETVDARFGGLDIAVACLGTPWTATALVDVTPDAWRQVVANNLTAHLLTAQALLPRIRSGGAYVFVNGGRAEKAEAGAGPVCMCAAAQLMMKDVLVAESADRDLRINTVSIHSPVLSRSRPDGSPTWLTADEIGRFLKDLVSSPGPVANGETIRLREKADLVLRTPSPS